MIQLGSKAKKPFIWVPKNPQPGGFDRGRIFHARTLLIRRTPKLHFDGLALKMTEFITLTYYL